MVNVRYFIIFILPFKGYVHFGFCGDLCVFDLLTLRFPINCIQPNCTSKSTFLDSNFTVSLTLLCTAHISKAFKPKY